MNRPILTAIVGLTVLGGAIGAYVVASPGGEEEVLLEQQVVETPVPTPTRTCSPSVSCNLPTPAYTCIYTVMDGEGVCVPVGDPLVSGDACPPIQFKGRGACLPTGATHGFVINEAAPGIEFTGPKDYFDIRRGTSAIRYNAELVEFSVAPEDAADFAGLRLVFLPEP